jgi:hypothetical protein
MMITHLSFYQPINKAVDNSILKNYDIDHLTNIRPGFVSQLDANYFINHYSTSHTGMYSIH